MNKHGMKESGDSGSRKINNKIRIKTIKLKVIQGK